jgi:hypothetical protein
VPYGIEGYTLANLDRLSRDISISQRDKPALFHYLADYGEFSMGDPVGP